jgi:hypothetical protein
LIDDDERAILEILPQGSDAAERYSAADAAEWVRGLAEHPEQMAKRSDPGDEWFLEDPDRRTAFVESFREAVRQGPEAMAPQFVAQIEPWGFRLEDITMPVHVWAGAHDEVTPPELMLDAASGHRTTRSGVVYDVRRSRWIFRWHGQSSGGRRRAPGSSSLETVHIAPKELSRADAQAASGRSRARAALGLVLQEAQDAADPAVEHSAAVAPK